ncbi:MAG: hypothetical protein M1821_001911 [Bathelium mastoideum]|nr:MAG: hypothetical protein M1821_001911 [Bathelium mastoideum]KAI9692421.1 MAG: hypothetical protein M1822_006652 [Bathelium mastoideum]
MDQDVQTSTSPPPIRTLADDIVTARVGRLGEDHVTFHVHKGLICEASDNFRATFTNGMKETLRNEVVLTDEEDIVGFPIFMRWLYTGKLGEEHEDGAAVNVDQLCWAYIFCDKRQVSRLQNLVVNTLVNKFNSGIENLPPATISLIYENTSPTAFLRNIIVSSFRPDVDYLRASEDLPKELLRDLCVSLVPKDIASPSYPTSSSKRKKKGKMSLPISKPTQDTQSTQYGGGFFGAPVFGSSVRTPPKEHAQSVVRIPWFEET